MIELTDEHASVLKQGYPLCMFVPKNVFAIRAKLPIWLRIRLSVWPLPVHLARAMRPYWATLRRFALEQRRWDLHPHPGRMA
jgi:hypothetical protein